MGRRFLTDEEKRLWKEINKETKPLKTEKKELALTPVVKKSTNNIFPDPFPFVDDSFLSCTASIRSSKEDLIALDRKTKRKIRKTSIKIEGCVDLHGLTQQTAYDHLVRFMMHAAQNKYRLVLVITGKGQNKGDNIWSDEPYGILRQNVPLWLANKRAFPFIRSVSVADAQDGGEGALYVFLRHKFSLQ